MTITEIINNVLAGGMLGSLGQGVRIAVGLKKFNQDNAASASQGKPVEEFSTSRLLISIFIGFVAGAVGMLVKGSSLADKDHQYSTEAIITIIAIGYSGADFIEGVFNTYINKFNNSNQTINNPSTNSGNASANSQPTLVHDEANFSNAPAQG
jgi:hypothetical protein